MPVGLRLRFLRGSVLWCLLRRSSGKSSDQFTSSPVSWHAFSVVEMCHMGPDHLSDFERNKYMIQIDIRLTHGRDQPRLAWYMLYNTSLVVV